MDNVIEKPTAESVKAACKKFDHENRSIEGALNELFRQYPLNTDAFHVLLKVTTLNCLYSTQIPLYSRRIPTVFEVTDHIVGLGIDSKLEQGSSDLVLEIAKIENPKKRVHYNYSFATKYCSWQRPDAYPIFDSRVNEYLWHLRKLGGLHSFKRDQLWTYRQLKEIVTEFRARYDLGEFTFKEIDKFLYQEGGKLLNAKQKQGEVIELTEQDSLIEP